MKNDPSLRAKRSNLGARRLLRALRALAMTAPFLTSQSLPVPASEVVEETKTRVVIREHPKTGKPYVSIVSTENPDPPDPFTNERGRILRPDYRLLDPKVKSGAVPYEGPVSDRTKIYIFAASLATLGAVSALALPVAATTGAASGGAGAYFAGGAAVAAGSAGAYSVAASSGPEKEDYDHESEYQLSADSTPGKRDKIV